MIRRCLRTVVLAVALVGAAAPAAADDLPVPTHDPARVEDLADEITDRDEFRQPEPNLLDRLRDWIEERLADLLEGAFSGSAGSLVGWLVLGAAIAGLVWFATRFGRTMQSGRGMSVRVDAVPTRTPAEWRAEAEAHEAAGRWKAALRCRYRALVGDLVADGVLDEVAGRTTGEFRRAVADAAPDRAPDFAAATELFELAWYGDRPTGEAENVRFRALADGVTGVRA